MLHRVSYPCSCWELEETMGRDCGHLRGGDLQRAALYLELEDFDAVPVVPQLLLQLRNQLPQLQDLLLALLILMEPVGHFIGATKHVRAPLLIPLWQRGHDLTAAIGQHLVAVLPALDQARALLGTLVVSVPRGQGFLQRGAAQRGQEDEA